MSDDRECCVSIKATTRARLAQDGLSFSFRGEFVVDILRRDGHTLRYDVSTIAHVAELVRELHPRRFSLQCARDEDAVQLKDHLDALVNHDATTLH
ncbi:MAG: hypothetical protein ACR2HE_10840 [Casimicrobiaceae bacterium]